MIVSHRHKFVFIKTRKTAGTSIEVFLSQFCGPEDIITPIEPRVEPHAPRNHEGFYNHIPASEVQSRIGKGPWEDYFTFCVERNPWDKTLSYYHFVANYRLKRELSFDEYLATGDFCVDHPRYTLPDRSDTLMVDRVLKYENLQRELAEVFGALGIPYSGSLGVNAKSEFRTDKRPYREVYTPAQARQVAATFAREIDLFGYSF
jgi:hypothetical protein